MDSRVGPKTQVEVLTEGIFVRQVLADPELPGVAAVLFDEFHERSLDADLGLALALDVQGALRADLRLLPMSATLDEVRLAALLDGADVIRSEGRMFEVETHYLGRPAERRLEDAVAGAVRKAVRDETGGVLVFLPGRGEIDRTAERLTDLGADIAVLPLHGGLDPKAQDMAVRPLNDGRRKIVLATAIAETSLTIPDIRIVIDAGLARVPRFDPAVGLTRLATERATLSAAEQRRGRAGRVGTGVCYRLWDEAGTRSLSPFPRPEILEADLRPLALALADWGAADPSTLTWLDPPPAGPFAAAVVDLESIDALKDAAITAHGRKLLGIAAPPRMAHMIVAAAATGQGRLAALVAMLASERGLGGNGVDLRPRLTRLLGQKGSRAAAARALADRMAKAAGGGSSGRVDVEAAGEMLALAWPDRIAKARGAPGRFQMANGRQAFLDETDPLASAEWLVVADATGRAAEARITAAAPIDADAVLTVAGDAIESRRRVAFDAESQSVRVRIERRLGRLKLGAQPAAPTAEEAADGLVDVVRTHGIDLLPLSDAARDWLARAQFVAAISKDWPDMSATGLAARADEWLPMALNGARAVADIQAGALTQALKAMLDWGQGASIDTQAPEVLQLANGRSLKIGYADPNGPVADAMIQDLFGVQQHPMAAGRPVLLRLLSPARRPAQTTQDLPGFWSGSYGAVRADLRGRYPKHPWPDDPAGASPPQRRGRR
jgi:ATP-dependent helicase HrpB